MKELEMVDTNAQLLYHDDSNLCMDTNDLNINNDTNGQVENKAEEKVTHDDLDDKGDQSVDGENTETLPYTVTDQRKLQELISEQQTDPSLANCMHQAKAKKGNYLFKSGALFHREKIADQWVEQLVLPQSRRKQVMHLAHRT